MARDYRKELTAWNSPENRKKRQKEYMEKHGPQKPRRKRLWPPTGKGKTAVPRAGKGTKDLRERLKEITLRTPRPNINESFGGGVKAKPHSTKEGRTAAGKRRIKRLFSQEATRPKTGRPLPRPGWKRPKNIMTPLRAKHGIGSLVKKIITKIKPKPKPKPKPGKGLGSGIKPSEAKDILKSPGKSWDKTRAEYLREYAPYFGGRSMKKEMKEGVHARNKESKKVFKSAKGKAAGGRIGLKHGGSAGAAIRGRGAEIK